MHNIPATNALHLYAMTYALRQDFSELFPPLPWTIRLCISMKAFDQKQ